MPNYSQIGRKVAKEVAPKVKNITDEILTLARKISQTPGHQLSGKSDDLIAAEAARDSRTDLEMKKWLENRLESISPKEETPVSLVEKLDASKEEVVPTVQADTADAIQQNPSSEPSSFADTIARGVKALAPAKSSPGFFANREQSIKELQQLAPDSEAQKKLSLLARTQQVMTDSQFEKAAGEVAPTVSKEELKELGGKMSPLTKKILVGSGLLALGGATASNMASKDGGTNPPPTDDSTGVVPPTDKPKGVAGDDDEKKAKEKDTEIKVWKPADLKLLIDAMKPYGLNAEQKAEFEEKRSELKSRQELLMEQYKKDKERVEWAEVAEMFGHALTQLGAGLTGMRTGVDLSGLKFNKTDWDSKYNRLMKDLDRELGLVDAEKKEINAAEDTAEKMDDKQKQEFNQLLIKDFYDKQNKEFQLYAQTLKNAGKDEAAQKKAKERLAKLAERDIAGYNKAIKTIEDLEAGVYKSESGTTSKDAKINDLKRILNDMGHFEVEDKVKEADASGKFNILGWGVGYDWPMMKRYVETLRAKKLQQVEQLRDLEEVPTSDTGSKYQPGQVVEVNGAKYRIGDDGDSLIPIQ